MHKDFPVDSPEPPRKWKPVVIKHGALRVRVYARIGEGRPLLLQHQPPAKRRALPAPGALQTASGALPATASMSVFPAYSTATSLGTNAANGPAASEASGGGGGLFGVSLVGTGGGGGYDSKATTQCGSERAGAGAGGGGGDESSSMAYPIMGYGTQHQRAAAGGAGGAPEKGGPRAMDAEMETTGAEGGGADAGEGDRMDTDDREVEGRPAPAAALGS
jgi:hypothetical protein